MEKNRKRRVKAFDSLRAEAGRGIADTIFLWHQKNMNAKRMSLQR